MFVDLCPPFSNHNIHIFTMSTKFPPFITARQHALELAFQSKGDYIKWHKENNPQYLPRYPNRVYKEFVSWNDFLGTQNFFAANKPGVYRPYWEAVKWSQANAALYNIDTGKQWVEWCHANKGGLLPKDIPQSPEVVYLEFKGNGWEVWLGQNVRAKMKAIGVQTHLFAICSHENLSIPGNYYTILHAKQGEAELKEKLALHKDMKLYRAYKWDESIAEEVTKLIDSFSKDMGEGKIFIPNLNSLLFELDCMLEFLIKKVG
jgi:hypothetical protein